MDPKTAADAAVKVAQGTSSVELATIILLLIIVAKAVFDIARLWYGRGKKEESQPTGFSVKQAGLVMRWLEAIHKNVVGDTTLGAEGLAKRLGGLEAHMDSVATALQATSDNLKDVAEAQKEIATSLKEIRRARNGGAASEDRLAKVLEGLATQLEQLK